MALLKVIKRELHRWGCSKLYLACMALVPVGMALFFLSLLGEGLPLKVPTAVVDMDHSAMSRSVTRALGASELLDIDIRYESYADAMASVRRGEIFGFFVIPADFERDVIGGRTPTLEYFSNMTYFVPGTLTFKGFKTIAVTTTGGVVKATLVSSGMSPGQVGALIQPMTIQDHPIGNPWLSYSVYLCPTFTMAVIALMVMMMTAFSITSEIKHGTSAGWLETAGGSMRVALLGKTLPATLVYVAVSLLCVSLMFCYRHLPMNGSMGWIVVATVLFVLASQAFGVFVAAVLPNPRMAMTVISLFGVLSFSFTGFSFPVESMYGAIGIFSYIAPVRYWFLIYGNIALDGAPLYYSRLYFAALLVFWLLPLTMLWKLKRACLKPVYVP